VPNLEKKEKCDVIFQSCAKIIEIIKNSRRQNTRRLQNSHKAIPNIEILQLILLVISKSA
jgi:hypothetical protein